MVDFKAKERLDKIEKRYGEDIADAVSMAVHLFADPDIHDSGEAPDGDWSLYHFRMAAATDPMRSIDKISDQANRGMEFLVRYIQDINSGITDGQATERVMQTHLLSDAYQCFNEIDSMTVEDEE